MQLSVISATFRFSLKSWYSTTLVHCLKNQFNFFSELDSDKAIFWLVWSNKGCSIYQWQTLRVRHRSYLQQPNHSVLFCYACLLCISHFRLGEFFWVRRDKADQTCWHYRFQFSSSYFKMVCSVVSFQGLVITPVTSFPSPKENIIIFVSFFWIDNFDKILQEC